MWLDAKYPDDRFVTSLCINPDWKNVDPRDPNFAILSFSSKGDGHCTTLGDEKKKPGMLPSIFCFFFDIEQNGVSAYSSYPNNEPEEI